MLLLLAQPQGCTILCVVNVAGTLTFLSSSLGCSLEVECLFGGFAVSFSFSWAVVSFIFVRSVCLFPPGFLLSNSWSHLFLC